MRPGGPQWIWVGLLGVGVLAVVLVLVGIMSGGDDPGDGTSDDTTSVVATDREEEDAAGGGASETTTEPTSVVVPDVRGMSFVAAGERAEEAGLIADSFPVEEDEATGTVVSQDPAPGDEVAPTRHLRLNVSLGSGPREMLRVPDVTGPDAPRARQIAWERRFTTLTADRDAPTAEEVGEVILQEPAAGTQAPALTQITLYVGR